MTRTALIERKTRETDVRVDLTLEGTGATNISTGVGMYDHLLTSFGVHGLFDLDIATVGDLYVDEHHTVEDTAIALGEAFDVALGDRAGITRFASIMLPMDESMATVAIDLGGRAYTVLDIPFIAPSIGTLGTQMVPHALEAFAASARMTMHVSATGRNDHHISESVFKALARCMSEACELDPHRQGIPSTKGVL